MVRRPLFVFMAILIAVLVVDQASAQRRQQVHSRECRAIFIAMNLDMGWWEKVTTSPDATCRRLLRAYESADEMNRLAEDLILGDEPEHATQLLSGIATLHGGASPTPSVVNRIMEKRRTRVEKGETITVYEKAEEIARDIHNVVSTAHRLREQPPFTIRTALLDDENGLSKNGRQALRDPLRLDQIVDPIMLQQLVDEPVRLIEQLFEEWTASLRGFALGLMGILFLLALLVGGWELIFGSLAPADFVKTLAQLTIIGTIFFGLLHPMPGSTNKHPFIADIAKSLVVFFDLGVRRALCPSVNAAGTAEKIDDAISSYCTPSATGVTGTIEGPDGSAAQSTFSPGFIVVRGLQRGSRLVNILDYGMENSGIWSSAAIVPLYIMGGMAFFIIGIMYLIMAIMVALVWIEGYLVISIGVFMIAFGVFPMVRDKAMAYIWYIVGWAVRIATMMMIFFFVDGAFDKAVESNDAVNQLLNNATTGTIYYGPYLLLCIVYIITPFFTTLMMHSVSNTLAGMVGGGSSEASSQMTAFSRQVASLGTVALAAKGVSSVASGGAGGVRGAVGGASRFSGARGEGMSMWKSTKFAMGGKDKSLDVATSRAPKNGD